MKSLSAVLCGIILSAILTGFFIVVRLKVKCMLIEVNRDTPILNLLHRLIGCKRIS